MRRVEVPQRPNWQQTVSLQGLVYWDTEFPDGTVHPYWAEGTAYVLTEAEADRAEAATRELVQMYRDATAHILENDWLDRFDIPKEVWPAIIHSWEQGEPSIAGRFDMGWDGDNWKLFEFNADAAAMILESSLIQLAWAVEVAPGYGQFNRIHELLLERWSSLPHDKKIWFASSLSDQDGEDFINTNYMRVVASLAGHDTGVTVMDDIAWGEGGFHTRDGRAEAVWKMYAWDFMVHDQIGALALRSVTNEDERTQWFEPIWRYLWQSKAMLAVLWELFPDHPLLLPTYLDGPHEMTSWVRKPLHGYEGANILVNDAGVQEETGGEYAGTNVLYQGYYELPTFDSWRPVWSSWVVGDEPAGLCVRESQHRITDRYVRFVPHLVDEPTGESRTLDL